MGGLKYSAVMTGPIINSVTELKTSSIFCFAYFFLIIWFFLQTIRNKWIESVFLANSSLKSKTFYLQFRVQSAQKKHKHLQFAQIQTEKKSLWKMNPIGAWNEKVRRRNMYL